MGDFHPDFFCFLFFLSTFILSGEVCSFWALCHKNQLTNQPTNQPYITIWSTINPRKSDDILTLLRIGHSRLTHTHLLMAEDQPTCPHYHSSVLTIRHILSDCFGLRHKYRQYNHSSSPSLTNLLGENPHPELFNFFKRYKLLSWDLAFIIFLPFSPLILLT